MRPVVVGRDNLLKLLIAITCCVILLTLTQELLGAQGGVEEGLIRKPVVAGSFYRAEPRKLQGMVDKFLMEAKPPSIGGELVALIVPHAGYTYSGPIAAFGYKLLEARKFDLVVVLAPSHHVRFAGASVYSVGDYLTPLGRVRVDRGLCDRLIGESEKVTYYRPAHLREHSLEVQLPFLQRVLDDFSLVPVVMGDRSVESCEALADALVKILKDKSVIFIASSDMSHYHNYKRANSIDTKTLRLIEKFSPLELLVKVEKGEVELCGAGPVVVAMMVAQRLGADNVKVLRYANSGDTAHDRSKVVGYCAVAFYRGNSEQTRKVAGPRADSEGASLSEGAESELLSIARESIKAYLDLGEVPDFKPRHKELARLSGAFVTLYKHGRLKGCIGHFEADMPLHKVVAEMTVAAATKDRRFFPVSKGELDDIELEISVLSPLKKIDSIDEIELGKHGIYIVGTAAERYGTYTFERPRSGCYLPKVATETGWTKIELLEHCSQDKAGLGKDGWKDADIYIFTTEVFGDK